MSKTTTVLGKITEFIGGDYEIYSEGSIIANAQKSIIHKADGGIFFGTPNNPPPMEVTSVYIKVRLEDISKYNGEFGFDWIDIHPDSKDVEKIQDVPFSDVEYFYKKSNIPNDLGNIVEKLTDVLGAQTAILSVYNYTSVSKHVDLPYVLIKPNQEIQLVAETIMYRGEGDGDIISITGDDFYEFEIIGGQKDGKTSKKAISKNEKLTFKIKCLKESSEKKYYFTHQTNTNQAAISIGGFTMMENKVLKLKFRVIALVSNENDPNAKAKALFKGFKEAGIRDFLNKNSLNQAGYEVEIENQTMFDNLDRINDFDEFYYAFDKTDWGSPEKRYFSRDEQRLRYYIAKNDKGELDTFNEIQEGQVGDYFWETTNTEGQKVRKVKRNNIEIITIKEYNDKIKIKYKLYSTGGFIILCDLENTNAEAVAFSYSQPLDNYTLFMNKPSLELKEVYSHEIGHMLGLSHSFYKQLEIDAYENAKKSIIGNNEPQYLDTDLNNDGKKDQNPNYSEGYNKFIINQKIDYENNKYSGYTLQDFYLENDKLILYLKNYNSYHLSDLKTKNYDENYKQRINNNISINKTVVESNQNSTDCKYKLHKIKCYVLPHDYFLYLERRKKNLYDIILQLQSNVVFYQQKSTKNFLDYYNTRVFFTHNQILTMRDDSKNFIEEICTCKQNSQANQNVISKPVQTKTKK